MTATPPEPASETPTETPAAAPAAEPAPAAAAAGPEPHGDSPIVQAVAPGYEFEGTALELGGLMLDATTLTSTHIRIPLGI